MRRLILKVMKKLKKIQRQKVLMLLLQILQLKTHQERVHQFQLKVEIDDHHLTCKTM